MKGGGKGSVTATYDVEGTRGVQLDGAVEIAKQYGYRQKHKVDGISDVMPEQLDELAHKHPSQQRTNRQQLRGCVPGLRALVAEQQEQQVARQSWRRQSGQEDGVGTPHLTAVME